MRVYRAILASFVIALTPAVVDAQERYSISTSEQPTDEIIRVISFLLADGTYASPGRFDYDWCDGRKNFNVAPNVHHHSVGGVAPARAIIVVDYVDHNQSISVGMVSEGSAGFLECGGVAPPPDPDPTPVSTFPFLDALWKKLGGW